MNKGVIAVMRKIPQIYDSTVKYILGQSQRHLKMLYNPIYQERMVSRKDEDIYFYEIEKMTLQVKKEYKEADGSTEIPKRINIVSEQERAKLARERLKKRAEMGQGAEKKMPVPQKKDIILNPKIPSSAPKEPQEEQGENIKAETEKNNFKFEILKEEVDFLTMVKENKTK